MALEETICSTGYSRNQGGEANCMCVSSRAAKERAHTERVKAPTYSYNSLQLLSALDQEERVCFTSRARGVHHTIVEGA